jgi:hypothetical protein
MGAFAFRLEREDATPAEPETFQDAMPNWRPGDTIPLGRGGTLRVVAIRDDGADQPQVLVVEDLPGPATSERVAQPRSCSGPLALLAPRRSVRRRPSTFSKARFRMWAQNEELSVAVRHLLCDTTSLRIRLDRPCGLLNRTFPMGGATGRERQNRLHSRRGRLDHCARRTT